ncbi:hypothetical protein DID88_005422 [Monilinia fructigena]|uniref:Uncharacterized protein n=1 Tax=Monilinia fructigena TaxID=38457 RepID=A0A395J0J3_9HELO|nr:hypothetical protein DID88_005422 [Monilinia fructigena]
MARSFRWMKIMTRKNQAKRIKSNNTKGKYTLCILSISNLFEIYSKPLYQPKDSTLLSLLPFTNTANPWTTPQSQQIATAILEKHNLYIQSPEFLVTYLLQSFIRPIFSKMPAPKSVTASSRKAAPSSAPPRHFDIRESSPSRQPWRSNIPYTIPVLKWIIESISSDILRTQAFPLLIPPLLTLLDSPSNSIRSHTLQILPLLFFKMGDKLLLQTGLGDVFEDAIHPVLLFLPSLTPVEDTLKLLPVGYKALYALCDARWSEKKEGEANTRLTGLGNKPSNSTANPSKSPAQLRLAFLDRIILSFGNIRLEAGENSEQKKSVHEDILKELQETGKVFVVAVRGTEDEDVKRSFEQELLKIIETDEELASIFTVN